MKKTHLYALIGAIALCGAGQAHHIAHAANALPTKTVTTSYSGTISSLDTLKDAFKLSVQGHQVVILLGKSFATGTPTLQIGDSVLVSGVVQPAQFADDPIVMKAHTLVDNGTSLELHSSSPLVTYSTVPVTSLSILNDSIRITAGSKIIQVRLGKKFLLAHPLQVGDKVTITGTELGGLFNDSPSNMHPTSITVRGTTYSHLGTLK
jgi:hypothetical protein